MNGFYSLKSDVDYWEYIIPDYSKLPLSLRNACINGEFQYIDRLPITLEVLESSGDIFPDFIYNPIEEVPLISDELKNIFNNFGIDNLFYKQITLVKKSIAKEKVYWLALPPRIDCINFELSCLDEVLNTVSNISICEEKVGYYNIFKLSNVVNSEIIVTQKFYEYLSGFDSLESLYLNPLK